MVAASFVPLPELCDVGVCVSVPVCARVHVIDGLQQQLAAYVSWVNSQLKRKPGLKPVRDLRHDLQDGVVLVQLIEIVGKYSIAQ